MLKFLQLKLTAGVNLHKLNNQVFNNKNGILERKLTFINSIYEFVWFVNHYHLRLLDTLEVAISRKTVFTGEKVMLKNKNLIN